MRELFPTRDNLANKISYYHLLLLMASLPFDRFYSHLILISFALHTLIQFNRLEVKPVFNWRTLLLQSVFFITVISTIYTAYKLEAFQEWGKDITIFLLPLLFCFTRLDIKKYREPLLLGFSLICVATILYLYFDAFRTIRFYKLPFSSIFSATFTNHNFSEPIDMHATFFSMQLAIALVYLLTVLIKERMIHWKLFYAVCICVLAAGLLQLCSKSVVFCVIITINLLLPYLLLKGYQRWKFILSTAAISLILMIGLFSLGSFKERYITDLKVDLSQKTSAETTDPRLARWETALGLITESPMIGHGAGSEIGLLHQAYFTKKYYNSFLNKLNAHNQYLSFLLKAGIVGLLAYLTTLTFGFRIAFAKKDLLFTSFMLLVAIVSLSENLLDVDKGIFFYAYFFSFFVFSNETKNKTAKEEKQHKYELEPA